MKKMGRVTKYMMQDYKLQGVLYLYSNMIKKKLNEQLELGHKRFVIYPFCRNGRLVKYILNGVFNLKEEQIIDNGLANGKNIIKVEDFVWEEGLFVLVCNEGSNSYNQIRNNIQKYVPKDYIIDIFPNYYKSVDIEEVCQVLDELDAYRRI